MTVPSARSAKLARAVGRADWAAVLGATGGTAFGALTVLPALRLNRARRWRLTEDLVIVLACCTGLAGIVLVTAVVVAAQGGDAIAAVVLGGAATLPIGLGITVGALLFPVIADSRGRVIAGALLLVFAVGAALVLDR